MAQQKEPHRHTLSEKKWLSHYRISVGSELVTLLIAVRKCLQKQFKGGKAHIMAEQAWRQEREAAAPTASTVREQRDGCQCACFSVQDPSPLMVHSHSVWVPLHLTLSGDILTDVPSGLSPR